MPRYEYKCDKCTRDYIEQRQEEEPQFFTDCDCGGKFVLANA